MAKDLKHAIGSHLPLHTAITDTEILNAFQNHILRPIGDVFVPDCQMPGEFRRTKKITQS